MNLNLSTRITDNVTELLNRIIDFTERRKEILTRNLFDFHNKDFKPKDLPVYEFSDTLTRALAEHINNKRLVLEDRDNIHFHEEGDFEASALVDLEALELLKSNAQAYMHAQIQKLSENQIHNRLALELLRQKKQKELEFTKI